MNERVSELRAGSATVLIGGPGYGKTTLWEEAVESARRQHARVLTARPSQMVSHLPFAGLIDLADGLSEAELAPLPEAQRRALAAVLMRAEPSAEPPPPAVVAVGLLGVVRALAEGGPVLVAIDDLHWLDSPSAEALTFVVHRLAGARVAFVFARRPGRAGSLEAVLSRGSIERIEVGALSLGAVRRLLAERLGLTISRHRLRRIVEATDGNPLFALEIGRSLLERGTSLEDELPLPDSLEELLGERVASLSAAAQRVLLAVALSEDPRVEQLLTVVSGEALDDAVDAGAVLIDGGRVRASHPMLAAAAEGRSKAGECRDLHLALAAAAIDEPARTMHLALAAYGPDARLATRAAAAADEARRRGVRRQAALLAGHALRLTPAGAVERPARVLELAERLDDAGELRRMTALVQDELGTLAPGPLRARAWVLLSESDAVSSREDQDRYLDRALAECPQDPNLRARALAKKAGHAAAAAVSDLDQAEQWGLEALECASDMTVRRYALWALAWSRALGGRPLDDLCDQSSVAADPTAYISAAPERVAAKRLFWRGELGGARTALRELSDLADERGDLTSYAMIRMHTIEAELRCGNLPAVKRLLDEWAESSDFETQFRPQYPRCRALLHAVSGHHDDAIRWATETIELAHAAGSKWDELEARHALGIAALLGAAPDQAAAEMWPVWEHCERQGVRDPGAFPVAADLVEALVELRRFEDADEILECLHVRAEAQEHLWARATVHRCAALLALARDGYEETSARRLGEAAAELHGLEAHFDGARCLLALGRAQRRAKQWRDARETLEQTVAAFGGLGAEGWADRAQAELDRVGGRRRADGELTPSERRVIELAGQGMSNKEIAAALYVAINTVEVHLSRAYVKLGVRSRGQLAQRRAAGA